MPNQSPFPSKDAELNLYFEEAVTHLLEFKERLNVSKEHQEQLPVYYDAWKVVFPLSQNKNTKTMTIVDNKNIAKENLKVALRTIYADIPQSALTTEDRNVLGIAARSTSRTPSPIPSSRPVGQVSTINRLEHTISFIDESGNHAKPQGVRGCQIYCKEGEPITDIDELSYIATDTKSPYVHKFAVDKAGKTMHYWLRWENTRGEVGPWGNVVTATVTG